MSDIQVDVDDLVIEPYELFYVLGEVEQERRNQNAKWGEQNHPWVHHCDECSGTDPIDYWFHHPGGNMGEDLAKLAVETAAEEGTIAYSDILMEEVVEALSATTPETQVEELIQVAAVAVAAIQSIRRNGQ